MKNILTSILAITMLAVSLIVFSPSKTLAVDVLTPGCDPTVQGNNCAACENPNATERPKFCDDNQTKTTDKNNPVFGPSGIVTKVVQILTITVGIASVLVIIVSGIRFITSGGNPETVSKARKGVTYAVAGLIITVLAQAIINFILSKV